MTNALLTPLLLHFAMVCGLYVWLTVARAAAVRSGQARFSDFRTAAGDPPAAARIARNLGNQFEAPLFAWAAALILIFSHQVTGFDIAAAWIFLVGRVIHTLVQTLTDNVRLRGAVFMINFVGIVMLMGHAAWLVIGPWLSAGG